MPNYVNISVQVGDVVDLRGAGIQDKAGYECFFAVIRTENKSHMITLVSDAKYRDLITGKIVKINKVVHTVRPFFAAGKILWKTFTNVFVDYENAFGERPNLVAENSRHRAMTSRNADNSDATWNRPEFTTGDVKDAKKED